MGQVGEIIAKLIAVGTTCVDIPSPIQGWTSLGPTKITSGPTQNLDWKVMVLVFEGMERGTVLGEWSLPITRQPNFFLGKTEAN
ncbi:hypothetical protein TSUD_320000 [Trifolium subterraneum]|uniref:Uncharacterized protein n=1 Tax=Trifolium subterraneum TaxID=3900 RepID=A0A2Z6NFQ6_TRISU|nr:hypothetical protein TSUD_320000 [Trifolium subterraneum]